MLGNASLTFSWQVWHLFVRAGGGMAWGIQDIRGSDVDGAPVVTRATGLGIGYSAGGGVTLPVAGPASLAFFANWTSPPRPRSWSGTRSTNTWRWASA